MNGAVFASHMLIVKSSLRFCRHQKTMNGRRHLDIAIDCAVGELDFKNVKAFAVTNGS
jgi:hypothetical protein